MEIDYAKLSDEGLYHCEATNIAGSIQREVKLDVHGNIILDVFTLKEGPEIAKWS